MKYFGVIYSFCFLFFLFSCVSKEKYESLQTIYELTREEMKKQEEEHKTLDSVMLEVSLAIDSINIGEGEIQEVVLERGARPDKARLLNKISSIDSFVRQANDRIFFLEEKLREAASRQRSIPANGDGQAYEQLQRRYSGLLSVVEKFKTEVAMKEAEINELRTTIENLKGNIGELTALVEKQKNTIDEKSKALAAREQELASQQEELLVAREMATRQAQSEIERLLKEADAAVRQGDDRGFFSGKKRQQDYQTALDLYRKALSILSETPVPGINEQGIGIKIQQIENKLKK